MRRILALFAFLLSAQPEPPPIEVHIFPGKALVVRIPGMKKQNIRDILSTFFSRGDENARKQFEATFSQSNSLTLIVTTDR